MNAKRLAAIALATLVVLTGGVTATSTGQTANDGPATAAAPA